MEAFSVFLFNQGHKTGDGFEGKFAIARLVVKSTNTAMLVIVWGAPMRSDTGYDEGLMSLAHRWENII